MFVLAQPLSARFVNAPNTVCKYDERRNPVSLKRGERNPSRRGVLTVFAGTLAVLSKSIQSAAQENEIPHFASDRYQFTELQPRQKIAPNLLFALDGRATPLTAFGGRPLLVNFWATWCPACRTELPILDRLQQELRHLHLQILAVSTDGGDRRSVIRYAESLKLNHLQLFWDPNGYLASHDPTNPHNAPFALYGMPITYGIAASGWIVGYMPGAADWTLPEGQKLIQFLARS